MRRTQAVLLLALLCVCARSQCDGIPEWNVVDATECALCLPDESLCGVVCQPRSSDITHQWLFTGTSVTQEVGPVSLSVENPHASYWLQPGFRTGLSSGGGEAYLRGDGTSIDPVGGDYTLEMWVKFENQGGSTPHRMFNLGRTGLGQTSAANNNLMVGVTGSTLNLRLKMNGSVQYAEASNALGSFPSASPRHVVVVFLRTGANWQVLAYLDGAEVLSTSGTNQDGWVDNNIDVSIGNIVDQGRRFNGVFHRVTWFGHGLSATEVATLYALGHQEPTRPHLVDGVYRCGDWLPPQEEEEEEEEEEEAGSGGTGDDDDDGDTGLADEPDNSGATTVLFAVIGALGLATGTGFAVVAARRRGSKDSKVDKKHSRAEKAKGTVDIDLAPGDENFAELGSALLKAERKSKMGVGTSRPLSAFSLASPEEPETAKKTKPSPGRKRTASKGKGRSKRSARGGKRSGSLPGPRAGSAAAALASKGRAAASRAPVALIEALDYVEDNGLVDEGIFRIAGVKAEVRKMAQAMKENPVHFDTSSNPDVHTVADAIKLYLRQMTPPVLSNEVIAAAAESVGNGDDAQTARKLAGVLKKMQARRRDILRRLVLIFKAADKFKEHSKMGMAQVTTLLAPNLVEGSGGNLPATTTAVRILTLGCKHTSVVFPQQ